MGHVSTRSDVFSLGITFYRMLTGKLPSYPYEWPPTGYDRLRAKLHPDFVAVLKTFDGVRCSTAISRRSANGGCLRRGPQ